MKILIDYIKESEVTKYDNNRKGARHCTLINNN